MDTPFRIYIINPLKQLLNIAKSLENPNVSLEKLDAFCGDNTNTNFVGLNRDGSNHLFSRLNAELGRYIEGVGCPAHVLHNTLSTAAYVLTVDVESIVARYSSTSIFTL